MTRNRKLVLAGALAGLVGTTALAGMALADPERGYGPGYGPGYGYHHMDRDGPRGQHPMWGGRGGWGGHHMGGGMWGGRGDWRGHMGGGQGDWRGHMWGGGPGFGGGPVMGRIFEDADANNDGKLTQEEIDAYRDARFAEFDSDGNGELSLEEFQALHQEITQPMTVRAFQMHDPDGNAAITKDEFASRTQGLVSRLDRDGDGALTRVDPRRGWGWGPMHHFYDDDNDDKDNDN